MIAASKKLCTITEPRNVFDALLSGLDCFSGSRGRSGSVHRTGFGSPKNFRGSVKNVRKPPLTPSRVMLASVSTETDLGGKLRNMRSETWQTIGASPGRLPRVV